MITVVITLLILCVGLVFIFLISLENISKDVEKREKNHKNEMEIINHRFNIDYVNVEKLKVSLIKTNEKNVLLEKRITKLENEILQLKSGDNSKFY